MESDSEFERRQEEEAAAEARRIGAEPGRDVDELPPGESSDPARRVVEEAGGGESEGFEQAESLLIENATEWQQGSPLRDAERTDEDERAFETRDSYGEADDTEPDDA